VLPLIAILSAHASAVLMFTPAVSGVSVVSRDVTCHSPLPRVLLCALVELLCLQWVHALGGATVKGNYGKDASGRDSVFEFQLTTLQAVALTHFNDRDGACGRRRDSFSMRRERGRGVRCRSIVLPQGCRGLRERGSAVSGRLRRACAQS